MVELRWAIPSSTTADRPRLQYRQRQDLIQFGSGSGWGDWQDVPFVVVPKTAPTAVVGLGVPASPRINPLCGVHGPIPCEGAGCICTAGVGAPGQGQR